MTTHRNPAPRITAAGASISRTGLSRTGLSRTGRLLLVGASALALAAPLSANQILFTTNNARLETGQRMDQRGGLTQIMLTDGGMISIVDAAEYRINADGSIDLYEGTITVAGSDGREIIVRMPEGVEGRIAGADAAGNFSVRNAREATGHALSGAVQIGRAGAFQSFAAGEMWRVRARGGVRRVIANSAQVQPDVAGAAPAGPGEVVAIGGNAGPLAAALNGFPAGLGDQLAGAGASADILAAARRIEAVVGNAALENFPSGDLALLVAAAARLDGAYGGQPFPEAQADIIRAYLRFLAGGGAGGQFVAAYSRFAADYLDLIRAGGLPSRFAGASPADIDAWLAYIGRTGALANLAARDAALAEAYLAFLANGGNRDGFAASFTDLTAAYFAFVRTGGDPAAFAGANQAAITQTIAFLQTSGLAAQLSAADRALAEAFLANGGLAFAAQYEAALGDYFAFLASGRRPSDYAALDQATLRAYLETLETTGLLQGVLGARAGFYAEYLAFLRSGGNPDAFAGLPANVFAFYATQLDSYFAFLASGRRPSEFAGTDIASLKAYIAELQAAGALDRFLGQRAGFFAQFAAFVAQGGNADAFGGLPANIFAGYAADLNALFAFLDAGGLPSSYTALSPQQIRDYLAALEAAGATGAFLGDLAGFYREYAAFLASGGNPDLFAGLPVPPDFGALASALNAYAQFLQAGGLPSAYNAEDLTRLRGFLDAVTRSGQLAALLGGNADLLSGYFAFLAGGGNPDAFSGLPVFGQYVNALNAYFAFLAGGGLPGDYTVLDQATINAYLAALQSAGGLATFGDLNGFFADYFAFVTAGGNPANFARLPVYDQYVNALNAYFAFLANGGLPGDYTALDTATINAYLAALANAQGGLAAFGDLDGFAASYAAFVLAGGDPVQFAGLPIYGDYIAALNAYFAFLAGGGLPSEYAALDQATLNAYLAALANAQGGLTAFGDLNAFFIEYFAFLSGGGLPDDFGGLPGRLELQFANARSFTFGPDVGQRFDRDSAASVREDGLITAITERAGTSTQETTSYAATMFTPEEFGRVGNDVAWTRYSQTPAGTATNRNVHLLVGTDAINLPTSGTINYDLIGGTAPTNTSAPDGEVGYFTGELAVAFGAQTRVGLNFDVTLGASTWRTQTTGGAANPASGGMVISNGAEFSGNLTRTGLNSAPCAGNCITTVLGGLFGDGGNSAGFQYFFSEGSGTSRTNANGVAVFGTSGTVLGGLGTAPPVVTPPLSTGTPLILANQSPFAATTGIKYNLRGPNVGLNGFSADSVVANSDRGITAIVESFRPRSIGTATAVDVSTNARFAIGRWTDGSYVSADTSENTALSATQGLHYLFAGPTTSGFAIPAAGRIDYDLIAATAPTIADGSLAPGEFQADMAVLFGATNRVAMEGSITMPKAGGDFVYGFSTQGGIANAEQSTSEFRVTQGRNVNFEILGSGITTSDNSCDANCTIQFAGYFAGADINQLGLTYNATGQSNPKNLSGAAIFGNGTLTGPPVSAVTGNQFSAAVTTDLFVSQGNLVSLDFRTANPGRTNSLDTVQITPGSFGYKTDADGQVIEIGGRNGWFDRIAPVAANFAAASNTDVGRTASGAVRWSRWSNGGVVPSRFGPPPPFGVNANGGYHIIIGTPSANLPTSGRADYTLVGGTSPTAVDGSVAPGVLTSGAAAVQFGASPKVGISLGFDYNSSSYLAQTTGGVANLDASELALVDGGFTGRSANGSVTGGACAGACSVEWTGFLAGDGGTELGVQYDIRFASDIAVIGTAAFAKSDPVAPPPPPPPPATGNPLSSFVLSDHMMTQSGRNEPLDLATQFGNLGFAGYETNEAGEITGFRRTFNGNLFDRIGTARNADSGGTASGDIRWTRWTEGTLEQLRLGPVAPISFNADQGYHAVVGTPATNLPATGRVDYTLSGGTSSTSAFGQAAPGQLISGAAAVEFGATSRVGIELAMDYRGQTITAQTSGGLAAVGSSELTLGQNATFRAIGAFGNVTSSGSYCAATCRVLWEGFLAGNGASEIGLTYSIQVNDRSSERLVGAAGFASSAAAATTMAPAAPTIAMAPQAMPAEWSRWTGTAPGGGAAAGGGAGLPMGLAPAGWAPAGAVPGSAGEPDRAAAIREAQSLMGGLIHYPGAGGIQH